MKNKRLTGPTINQSSIKPASNWKETDQTVLRHKYAKYCSLVLCYKKPKNLVNTHKSCIETVV